MENFLFNRYNYKGERMLDFFPSKDSAKGPGWFVFGRSLMNRKNIALCARPDVKPRKNKNYNILIQRGFKTMKEAQELCDYLNNKDLTEEQSTNFMR